MKEKNHHRPFLDLQHDERLPVQHIVESFIAFKMGRRALVSAWVFAHATVLFAVGTAAESATVPSVETEKQQETDINDDFVSSVAGVNSVTGEVDYSTAVGDSESDSAENSLFIEVGARDNNKAHHRSKSHIGGNTRAHDYLSRDWGLREEDVDTLITALVKGVPVC